MIYLDYKLAFIVSYRNREEHLSRFIPHYKNLFPDADIYVAHQLGDAPFNRGKLLNIGFMYAEEKSDAFDLCDVDMLAVEGDVDYSFPASVTHMASAASQFDYKLPYPAYFSGHVLLTAEHMRAVNGFYNDYAGYGCEDDSFYRSFLLKELPVQRRYGRYECLPHERAVDKDPVLMDLFNKNWDHFLQNPRDFSNGLSSCQYKIIQVHHYKDYTQLDIDC